MSFHDIHDKIGRMKHSRFNLAGLVMLVLATPVWLLVSIEAYLSTGFGDGSGRYIAAPLILCGLTVAIQRLVRSQKNSWPLSALIAGVVALVALLLASG
jgi:cytochrome c oxidase assembly factor CtaG